MKPPLLLFLLVLLQSLAFSGENPERDSLELALQKAKDGPEKALIYHELGKHWRNNDVEMALSYIEKGIQHMSDYSQDSVKAELFNNKGVTQYIKGDLYMAIGSFRRALDLRRQYGDSAGVGHSLNNIGVMHRRMGNYGEAIDYYLQALKIREALKDTIDIVASINNIGGVYYYQKNYSKALDYFQRAAEIFEKKQNSYGLATAYNNMALIFHERKDFEKAINYNLKSLKIRKMDGDGFGEATSYLNLGRVYYDMREFESARDSYKDALNLYSQIGDEKGKAEALFKLGETYYELGDLNRGVKYLKQSIEISEARYMKPQVRDAAIVLSKLQFRLGNYLQAYNLLYKGYQLNDSIFSEESKEKIENLQTKYETVKKEKEIEVLKREREIHELELSNKKEQLNKQRVIQFSLMGGVGLVLVLAFVIFRRFKEKQKANLLLKKQNNSINIQNVKIEKQNQELALKNQEITDSINYAKELQSAILPKSSALEAAFRDHFILFKPRDIVSGDFYWFTQVDGKRIIAAVDCTGHGVPGAFVSMLGNDLLNQIVKQRGITDPTVILSELHKGVKAAFGTNSSGTETRDGMDLALCVFDDEMRSVAFAGANRPLLMLRNGNLITLKADRASIGGDTELDFKFTTESTELQKGDRLYMFSDGYPDQFGGPKGKKFMLKQFMDLIEEMQTVPMQDQLVMLDKRLQEWIGNYEQIDDILVIGVEVS